MSLKKKQKSPEALRNASGSPLNSRAGPSTFMLEDDALSVEAFRSVGMAYRVRPHGSWEVEVIPDSEEERVREDTALAVKGQRGDDPFSDDENHLAADAVTDDPFEEDFPAAWQAKSTSSPSKNVAASTWTPCSSPQITKTRKYHTSRRIAESSDSEDSNNMPCVLPPRDAIEPVDSEPESPKLPLKPRPRTKAAKEIQQSPIVIEKLVPLFIDEEFYDDNYGDDAILTLNEPKSARKPFYTPKSIDTPASGRKRAKATKKPVEDVFGTPDVVFPGAFPEPTPATVTTPSTPPKKKSLAKGAQPPRTSKKAQAQAEQTRRREYAEELFKDLNSQVFGDRLPQNTKLIWNNRLLTTAGRAKWHRSRDGLQTTEIELADKVLDCDERIRNTLSHEMCHLASWIIDEAPTENHGKIWKAWALRVRRKRPEIEISTRHDYEISYKYQWKCEKCDKIYGRFSKSIDPDACVCGSCKEGKLIPLFATRKTTRNNTPKSGRNAAEKAQDSPIPLSIHSISVVEDDSDDVVEVTGYDPATVQSPTQTVSDRGVEDLIRALGSVGINEG